MKATFLFIITALAMLLWAARPVSPGYELGETVKDFKLKNVDGRMVALSDYDQSHGVILIFDCNTCPYSKAYNDRIIALHQKFGAKGFPVITVNPNDGKQSPGDSFQAMVARARTKNYNFPYLLDESQTVARAFGATNTPHVFLLQRKNEDFKVAYIGAIDNNPRSASQADRKYVEEAVSALLEGKPVPVEKTKAVGCGIKWKDG